MKNKKLYTIILILIVSVLLLYYVFGQEYRYAKIYANELFDFEIPEKTKVVEQNFDYGVLYGGGPTGSGGYPTVVAYIKLSSELSEKEIFNHYNKNEFEIFFQDSEIITKNIQGKKWYDGKKSKGENLSFKINNDDPIKFIVQYRKEFSYPFFIDLY